MMNLLGKEKHETQPVRKVTVWGYGNEVEKDGSTMAARQLSKDLRIRNPQRPGQQNVVFFKKFLTVG